MPTRFQFNLGWLALGLISLAVISCNIIQVEPVAPPAAAAGTIVFVTVTPAPATAKAEILATPVLPEPAVAPVYEGANELGQIMVLEYHRIAAPEQRYQRTPDNFRSDLQRLQQGGYYPVNFVDLIQGLPNVPAGKKPVVITFDDSDISQFKMLDDNMIDADSAVGILLNFHYEDPDNWPARATFFVLGDDTGDHVKIFGQPQWAKAKVQFLANTGMEIGSHTVNHTDLSVASAERIYWELAISKRVIEDMAPGYTVQTLSVPYGGFPYTLEFLKAGQWGDYSYTYAGNVAAWGGPTVSPFDPTFDPYHVPRIEVLGSSMDHWLTYFEKNPHEYYISDGDPGRITAPQLVEVATEE